MTTAFVLSGGASLGTVQVGMLQALNDAGVSADLLVGSSVGAINAAWIAAHPEPEGVEALAEIWRSPEGNRIPRQPAARCGGDAGTPQSPGEP